MGGEREGEREREREETLRWVLNSAGAETVYVCMYGSLKDESMS